MPSIYPEIVSVTTDFDENYIDADLKIEGRTNTFSEKGMIKLELYDPENNKVKLNNSSVHIKGTTFRITNRISRPEKWDSKHPRLYILKIMYNEVGKTLWQKSYPTGFREIEVRGKRFLVNGKPVKLRGACRHDVHPLLGRVSVPEYELKDVLLAKEATMNFIRTSHYPPVSRFLTCATDTACMWRMKQPSVS